jgi:TonB-dependent starch-binding outer membrane protein SusC
MKRKFKILIMGIGLLLFCFELDAQRVVTGTVTDKSTGEELIGASVTVKGSSSVGTITDFDGKFEITVPAGFDALDVSYAGYQLQEIKLGTDANYMVQLEQGTVLDELVVIGYGSVRRSDLTGSVSSLAEKDFNQGVIISPEQALQARVPGVNIVNNSGQPGGATTIQIRGNNSVRAGAEPLFVIDGFPLDGRTAQASVGGTDLGAIARSNPLNFINPADIESFEVLKDASAAAIYGARAANGVVLITLKKARKNQPSVNFNTSVGTSSMLRGYDILDAASYRGALSSYGLTGGDGGGSSDAMSEIMRNGAIQNYNLSFSSTSDNSSVRASVGYNNIQGIVRGSGLERYNASFNGNFKFLDQKAGVDILFIGNQTQENIAPVSTNAGFTGNLIGQALQWNPTVPLTTSDGSFTNYRNNPLVGQTQINPMELLASQYERATTNNVLVNISPYYKITDKLTYRYRLGINYGTGTTRSNIFGTLNVQDIEGRGWASIGSAELQNTLHAHTLNFNDKLSDNINFDAVIGYEYQKFDYRGHNLVGRGFTLLDRDNINAMQNALNTEKRFFSFADPISELQSYFGRINFGISNKYYLTGTVRVDGSSKFGENNKYGVFPSGAFRWRVSGEDFMSSNTLFDDLSLRLGVGTTGNQEFPAGAALDRFGLFENNASGQINAGNPDLRWESSVTYNAGIDFAMNNYKLTGTVEFFHRNTRDLLLDPFVSEPGPQVRAWRNLTDATVINSGVELSVNALVMESGKSSFNIGANATFMRNEFRDPSGAPILTGNLFGQGSTGAFVQRHVDGLPLNTYFVRDFQGLDEAGLSVFGNDEEPIEAGSPNPTTLLGVTLGYDYDKFSFVANFNGAFGHFIYNNTAMSVIPITNLGSRNIDARLLEGPRESTANAITSSSRYLESGNFLRLANTTLSYRVGNVGSSLKNLNIALTGQNLLLFTDYTGFDPEVNTLNFRDGVPSSGIEYIPYPTARSILLSVNVSF